MDPTKTTLLVTSQMGTYLLLVSSQQAQLTVRLRRNSRITSFIPPQDSTVLLRLLQRQPSKLRPYEEDI